MTVAPELFTSVRARRCLDVMRDALLGGMGMRTLDPKDMQYRPSYDNDNDSAVCRASFEIVSSMSKVMLFGSANFAPERTPRPF